MNTIPVYVDFLPNGANDPNGKKSVCDHFREQFENRLEAIVTRQSKLPVLMVNNTGDAASVVIELLMEARSLFCHGFDYSCVAMCGIVCERIVKDILRANLLVKVDKCVSSPPDKAFDQLERVDIRSLIQFATKSALLSDDTSKAAEKLGELRNQYAHARGANPEADALKAIQYLHQIVDGTVSILKEFTIENGQLTPKGASTTA